MDPEQVELKLNVNARGVLRAKQHLGLDDADATHATIWFCDVPRRQANTLHFALSDRGVIVRLRHKEGGDSDSTVKYRREAPLHLPAGWSPRTTDDLKVEGDWTTSAQTVAASLTAEISGATIDAAGSDGPPLDRRLFSADQRRFAADLLGPTPVELADLQPLGPVSALRWEETSRDDLGNELGAEQWTAGDLQFLELSIRVKFGKAEKWLRRFTEWAADERLDVAATGSTKTKAVLEHFARQLVA